MKIFVQGRKYGFNVIYPLPTPAEFYDFAKDNQSINAQNQSYFYGKCLFSIAFAKGGRIYTKYVLGYDVQRSNLGNISFSIFISDDKILPGDKVIEVLDTLSDKYFKTYAPDFFIKETQENWPSLVESVDKYNALIKSRDRYDIERLEMGNQDAAYIYYDSIGQLRAYFDDPYQSVYSPYSQIFFVDKSLKGKNENPLNALKHGVSSELTGKIDLDNKRYRLVLRDDFRVNVSKVSSGTKTPLSSNSHFFKKDELHIEWIKPFCTSAEQKGYMDSLDKYLEIDDENRTVTIKPVKLYPITKDIQPQFLLRGEPVEMEQFSCQNNKGDSITLEDGKLHFEGEQVMQMWTINASKAPIISARISFTPNDVTGVFVVKATEKKTIYFSGYNKRTNEAIPSMEISYRDSYGHTGRCYGYIDFSNEDLDRTFRIETRAKGYFPGGPLDIVPREAETPIRIPHVPKDDIDDSTWDENTSSKHHGHTPRKGSWFKRNLLVIILSVLLLISLCLNGFAAWLLISLNNDSVIASATEYIEGEELLREKLIDFSKERAIKHDIVAKKKVGLASDYRNVVDHGSLHTETWESYSLDYYRIYGLSRLYKICKNNPTRIPDMERYLRRIWPSEINQRPISEICDSLDSFVKFGDRGAVKTNQDNSSPVVGNTTSASTTTSTTGSDFPDHNNDESLVSESSSQVDNIEIPNNEKTSWWRRLFKKNK